MKAAQKPDHLSLNTLITRLKDGRYVIPDFQRDFEWKPWDIKELIRSIFLDYYIGSLLLWKGKKENFEALRRQPQNPLFSAYPSKNFYYASLFSPSLLSYHWGTPHCTSWN